MTEVLNQESANQAALLAKEVEPRICNPEVDGLILVRSVISQ